jgi:hypothetical protein
MIMQVMTLCQSRYFISQLGICLCFEASQTEIIYI